MATRAERVVLAALLFAETTVPATDLLRSRFAFRIGDFDPAVLHTAFVAIIVRDGLGFAVALSGHAASGDSVLC